MIVYEYVTNKGIPVRGVAEHLRVSYTPRGVQIHILDGVREKDCVEVVNYLTPAKGNQTYKFDCDRFTVDGRDIS